MNAAELAVAAKPVAGAHTLIRRFTLRRMMLGSVLFALFATGESAAQALGIVAAYPNMAQRAKIVYGLASNAALGLFYGDRHDDIITPAGYMVYRIAPILALVGAIWGLTYITKMLRGQEETGRWELLLSGQASARTATAKTIMGVGGGIVICYVIMTICLAAAGHSPKFGLSLGGSLTYNLALISAVAVAVGVGAITSQLAATRRRAMLYGLATVIVFFALRSVGNVADSLVWLKNLTPFGWIDKLHPLSHAQPIWFLPLGSFVVVTSAYAIYLAGKRDMAESFIPDSATAKPRLGLLTSQLGFDFRATRGMLFGWLFAGTALTAMIAGIDKTVAKSLTSAGGISRTISKITGNPYASIELAYLGAAAYLVVIVLMILVTNGLGATREEESSGRLDNFLSGTVSRSRWLGTRLFLLVVAATVMMLLVGLLTWALAEAQSIHIGFNTMVFGDLGVLGPVVFLLGFGALVYSLLPRFAVIAMYILIVWSFTIDIVASALKTSKYLADTSLLHHVALVPAAHPNWKAFGLLVVVGFVMMVVGILLFQNRDLQAE
jgi:ABC-2 type transport system permease protein